MVSAIFFSVLAATIASTAAQVQSYPANAKAPGTFASKDNPKRTGEPPYTDEIPDPIYGVRDIDIPFFRPFVGHMNFFSEGELNTPAGDRDVWGPENDDARQSACGIPDNAFFSSKFAIHPHFLEFAGLDRYCMQDACASIWSINRIGESHPDMVFKVTDICSTDPNDPGYCASPSDFKVDRLKAGVLLHQPGKNPVPPTGNTYEGGLFYWFLAKCIADGLPEIGYLDNWFAQPPLPNNKDWAIPTALAQYKKNQISYPKRGWSTYTEGGYHNLDDGLPPGTAIPLSEWNSSSKDPEWQPIAGGKGWGRPPSKNSPPPAPDAPPPVSIPNEPALASPVPAPPVASPANPPSNIFDEQPANDQPASMTDNTPAAGAKTITVLPIPLDQGGSQSSSSSSSSSTPVAVAANQVSPLPEEAPYNMGNSTNPASPTGTGSSVVAPAPIVENGGDNGGDVAAPDSGAPAPAANCGPLVVVTVTATTTMTVPASSSTGDSAASADQTSGSGDGSNNSTSSGSGDSASSSDTSEAGSDGQGGNGTSTAPAHKKKKPCKKPSSPGVVAPFPGGNDTSPASPTGSGSPVMGATQAKRSPQPDLELGKRGKHKHRIMHHD